MTSHGMVFNLQRYSLHDGPGIRTTVFLKGCPARCWWCHNPESQLPVPEISSFQKICLSCGACFDACPERLDTATTCTLCGACTDACPTGARQIVGREMSADEVMANLLKDRFFYEDSGGGVTFSGGEPLCQPDFLKILLSRCRDHEIHTAVDTAGLCPPETLAEIAPLVALFLFDLKCAEGKRHLQGTGIDNGGIVSNLALLSRLHANIWLRIPVVPGFNASEEEMCALAKVSSETPGIRHVWLLPYHATWTGKQARFGTMAMGATQLAPPTMEVLEVFAKIFRDRGVPTSIGGQ